MNGSKIPHDGTGGPDMLEALQAAVASRMVAQVNDKVTWAHILMEAVAFIMVETDPCRIHARLEALDVISADWKRDLKGRHSGPPPHAAE